MKVKDSNFSVANDFTTEWLLYTASGGSAIEQKYIEDNFTTVQLYERVLMKNIEVLMGM